MRRIVLVLVGETFGLLAALFSVMVAVLLFVEGLERALTLRRLVDNADVAMPLLSLAGSAVVLGRWRADGRLRAWTLCGGRPSTLAFVVAACCVAATLPVAWLQGFLTSQEQWWITGDGRFVSAAGWSVARVGDRIVQTGGVAQPFALWGAPTWVAVHSSIAAAGLSIWGSTAARSMLVLVFAAAVSYRLLHVAVVEAAVVGNWPVEFAALWLFAFALSVVWASRRANRVMLP